MYGEETSELISKINILLYQIQGKYNLEEKTELIRAGIENYITIGNLRAKLEKSMAKDLVMLHDVEGFLKRKSRKEHGRVDLRDKVEV